ncbi:MAG: C39 family peptidase [Ktedonobacterales bacterium]
MRRPTWLRRCERFVLTLVAALYLMTPLLGYFVLSGAFAQAKASIGAPAIPVAQPQQDAAWVARKLAFTVSRPRFAGDIAPSCAATCRSYPSASVLETGLVATILEPGPVGTDVAHHTYLDHNMTKLCGPAAAAVALAFWGLSPTSTDTITVTDPSDGVVTTWDAARDRAYIVALAWQARIPGWSRVGMMDDHDPSAGVTLYGMRDGLNWEASRHDAGAWHEYFYTVTWWDQSSAAQFHHQVQDDIANARVPVVAEVSARLLPNWSPKGRQINHFVTIVGYDDIHRTYLYTDTCGTGCGSLHDAGINTATQAQMWAAITAIPVNRSAAYNAGDGGYVW